MGRDAAAGHTHGFARALTSFVGRAGEVDQVAGLLGEYRLVTVTGPGGVGKTRLASEVAGRIAGRFADGVWLVELAGVQDPALVPATVAAALGLQQMPGPPTAISLIAGLSREQVLLVLDNCEHVLAAVAELCAALLPAADDLRVLATSREPVGVAGEVRYRLRPLPLSDPGVQVKAETSAAVALFADRARQADPDFALDGETGLVAARLVARLDGMPLAIELAAARVEALGLAQLIERLEDSFRLLTSTDRAAAERHRSLAATVEWSYQLLAEEERQVFRRLAMFPGPFTLDAAEAVAGASAALVVLHLVDCSMLTPPWTGQDGRARYLMLQTLRDFGLQRLGDAGDQDSTAAALARYAVTIAERAAAAMQGSRGELGAVRRLDAEDPMMQQALAWALRHDTAVALRLTVSLCLWWHIRGRLAAGYPLLNAAAGHAACGSEGWCAAQYWLGRAAHDAGDVAGSLGHYAAAIDALAVGAPTPLLADALAGRAATLQNLGRFPEAADDARRALSVALELRYPAGQARALLALQYDLHCAGDTAGVLALGRRAEQIEPETIPGNVARGCATLLTTSLIETGDIASAELTCTDALASAREIGDLLAEAQCLQLAAEISQRAGRMAEAGTHLQEAVALATRVGDRLTLLDCLDLSGHLCVATAQWAGAVTLWAALAACADQRALIISPPDAHRRREALQNAARVLGADRMREAEERGTAMTLETATEFAVLLISTDSGQPDAPDVPPGLAQLSARERELVILVAQGQTDAQIAGQLYISISTVRSHLDRIRDKTNCRRRADLTRLALRAGLA